MPINKIAHSSLEIERENYIPILRSNQLVTDIGWRIYNDASAIPVDGTGGTTNITWSQNTSNPLSGDSDLRLVKDANNRQGEGVSIDFTVSNRHLAKVLQITLDSELISGTFATGDLKFYIIANPNSTNTIIEPVNVNLQLGIANQRIRHIASFQTDISITSYRLCIHVASTSTSAYTVDFNNFKVWEPTQSIGSIITDWQNYTPTIVGYSGTTFTTYFKWRRVGGSVEIVGTYVPSGGASTTTVGTISLPLDLSADTSYGRDYIVGNGWRNTGTSNLLRNFSVLVNTSAPTVLTLAGSEATSIFNPFSDSTNLSNLTALEEIGIQATVPIAGWGSSVAMSSDTGDSRVVALKKNKESTQNITSGTSDTKITFGSTTNGNNQYDTHGTWDGTNNRYVTPISGYYKVYFIAYVTSVSQNAYVYAKIRVDNTEVSRRFQHITVSSGIGYIQVSDTVFLRAGQYVEIYTSSDDTNFDIQALSVESYLTIERISAGSQVIAASETVAMHARKSTGSVGNGTAVTSWTATSLDTHSGFNLTLGEYTVPMSGVYFFSGQTNDNSVINGAATIRLQTNLSGSFADISGTINGMYNTGGSIYYAPHFTHIRRCVAGEKLRLYSVYQGAGSNGMWLDSWFNVARIGI